MADKTAPNEEPKSPDPKDPETPEPPKDPDIAVFSGYVNAHAAGGEWVKIFAEEKDVEILFTDPKAVEALPIGKRLLITISEIEG